MWNCLNSRFLQTKSFLKHIFFSLRPYNIKRLLYAGMHGRLIQAYVIPRYYVGIAYACVSFPCIPAIVFRQQDWDINLNDLILMAEPNGFRLPNRRRQEPLKMLLLAPKLFSQETELQYWRAIWCNFFFVLCNRFLDIDTAF